MTHGHRVHYFIILVSDHSFCLEKGRECLEQHIVSSIRSRYVESRTVLSPLVLPDPYPSSNRIGFPSLRNSLQGVPPLWLTSYSVTSGSITSPHKVHLLGRTVYNLHFVSSSLSSLTFYYSFQPHVSHLFLHKSLFLLRSSEYSSLNVKMGIF